MLFSILRTIKYLIICTIISTAFVGIAYLNKFQIKGLYLFSFAVLFAFTAIDSFRYCKRYYHMSDLIWGGIVPYLVYGGLSVVGYKKLPFSICKYFLFPVRGLEVFGLRSKESIVLVSLIMLVTIFFTGLLGMRVGRRKRDIRRAQRED